MDHVLAVGSAHHNVRHHMSSNVIRSYVLCSRAIVSLQLQYRPEQNSRKSHHCRREVFAFNLVNMVTIARRVIRVLECMLV